MKLVAAARWYKSCINKLLNHLISRNMRQLFITASLAALLVTGFSCKGKDKDKAAEPTTTTTTDNTPPTQPPPPVIANDEALRQGVTDATKDIKGLTAEVKDSMIVLSGTISKADNMRVTPTLNSLHPKKIDRTNLKVQ